MATVLVGGDLCPGGINGPLMERGDGAALLHDLEAEFQAADLVVVNLECPLIREETPAEKCGPVLGASVACAHGLRAMGVDVAGLANNHVMDHGAAGLRSTMAALKENGMGPVGGGAGLEEARKILIREAGGMRVGILALAEQEFGMAAPDKPGANPLDIIDAVRTIDANRERFDHLVVLLHGGNEYYPYPRPGLMETCRFLVEQGAGAVLCQQSHCTGCMEVHQGAPIVYGQGNLLFDYPSHSPGWHEGLLIGLEPGPGGRFGFRLIPVLQSDGGPGLRRMPADDEAAFLDGFHERSRAIGDPAFVAARWAEFVRANERYYLDRMQGNPGVVRRLARWWNARCFLGSRRVNRQRLNLIRCESHREALIEALTKATEKR